MSPTEKGSGSTGPRATDLGKSQDLAGWKPLFKIAGISTMAMLVLIPIQIAVYTIWPFPESIAGWFELFESSRLLGLMHMDVLYIVNNTILAIMYLAFYFSLRQRDEAVLLVGVALGFLGIAAYYASSPAFEMLSLSGMWANSTLAADRAMFLAAGQVALAQWKGTAFDVYYVLNAIALLVIAGVMLKSPIYGRVTAIIGLVSGVLMSVPSTAGAVGQVFALASLVPWVVFSFRSAKKFLELGR